MRPFSALSHPADCPTLLYRLCLYIAMRVGEEAEEEAKEEAEVAEEDEKEDSSPSLHLLLLSSILLHLHLLLQPHLRYIPSPSLSLLLLHHIPAARASHALATCPFSIHRRHTLTQQSQNSPTNLLSRRDAVKILPSSTPFHSFPVRTTRTTPSQRQRATTTTSWPTSTSNRSRATTVCCP